MIDPHEFASRQMELTAEFAKYVLDNPDVDDQLPDGAYIYFQIDGEPEFNLYSESLAQRREQEEGLRPVVVHLKGLAPRQGSRLIQPSIAPRSLSQ